MTAVLRSYDKIGAVGRLAQLVARFLHTEEVIGSSPVSPTMTMQSTPSESVVVTGASTGIGRATVDDLVAHGFHVWAAVRKQSDADELTTQHGTAVTPLLLDLLDHDSVRAAGERVCAAGPLRALVNNAGIALPAPLEVIPIDVFERQFDINVVGQLLVTQVMLPALLAHGDARIVFIGSIGGRISAPVLGAYHASKHAVVALADSFRAELAPYRIRVSLIEPGVIATPIWSTAAAAGSDVMALMPRDHPRYAAQIARVGTSAKYGATGAPASTVARAVRRAIVSRRPRPRHVVGSDARIVAVAVRILPFRAIYRLTAGRS